MSGHGLRRRSAERTASPGNEVGRKCVARSPADVPPRVSCRATRSDEAMTALRTLMLSNGLTVVFSAM